MIINYYYKQICKYSKEHEANLFEGMLAMGYDLQN